MQALEDENAPKLLQFTPFLLSFLTIELPQDFWVFLFFLGFPDMSM